MNKNNPYDDSQIAIEEINPWERDRRARSRRLDRLTALAAIAAIVAGIAALIYTN